MAIKFLNESTISKIAAGEVIERPASVIKELIENAIDAKADKIDVILEQAGKNLIIVSDNGIDMPQPELEIAILRHTTSKLDEEDLLNISTFGFRGEALPSIAAISKITITSKAPKNHKAFEISLIGGKDTIIKTAVHNNGTKVEVRDLFFATPARLKFLRTNKTEFHACLEVVKRIALSHPSVSFSLIHDNKHILTLRKAQDIGERVSSLLGQDFIDNAACVNLSRPAINIFGYISLPTFNRATSEDQYLFINQRPVKDKVLNSSLRIAYRDYIAKDRYPVAALFLEINPQLIDVNVHPAKSEVRFHDPNLIRGLLISSIKDALFLKSNKTSSTIATTALGLFTTDSKDINNCYYATERDSNEFTIPSSFTPSFQTQSRLPKLPISITPSHYIMGQSDDNDNTTDTIEYDDKEHFLGMAKTQIYETYIISQTKDSIVIVDQHAAHERLVYEKIKQDIAKRGLIKQRLLIPEIVELPDSNRAELLCDKIKELHNLGLSIEKFGERSIIVSEIPHLLGDVNIQQLIQDIADNILEHQTGTAILELIEKITETYACHYSIRAGRKLTIIEMNELLRQIEKTPFSGQCNHGRPTYIELKLKDIEKLFSRK